MKSNCLLVFLSLTCLIRGLAFEATLPSLPRLHTRLLSTSLETELNHPTNSFSRIPLDAYDVVVVGSGIGGLSCAAMLAKYGYSVAVMESHYAAGGAAHGYRLRHKDIGNFYFDTGPSFFSGLNPELPAKSSNPLRSILDAIGERVECISYTTFGLKFPEGDFVHTPRFGEKGGVIEDMEGPQGLKSWSMLMKNMEPLAMAVSALPTAALRGDIGSVFTVAPFLPKFATLNPLNNLKLIKPFQTILDDSGITASSFTQRWLDLLCFCLSGLKADGTITAEMAMMMGEFYEDGSTMDCPKGGAKAIVDALVRGIEKQGGSIFLNSPVDKIVVTDGRATEILLKKSGRGVKATKAIISNLSVWDLVGSGIVDGKEFPQSFVDERLATPVGYGVLHIYTPATEDYSRWAGLERNSDEYISLKEERSNYLWGVLEKIIPDIRERTVVSQVGTPLTHERFLNRHRGSYGPAIRAGEASFPFPNTPIAGLLMCGDSCFPGIGIPAVAGSGFLAANSVSFDSIGPQLKLLQTYRK